jgi:hypothetical protein
MTFQYTTQQPPTKAGNRNPITSLLSSYTDVNPTLSSNAWEKRWGIGKTDYPPDTINEVRKPIIPVFVWIEKPNVIHELNIGIDNITAVWLSRIKMTGIVGTPEVILIRFKSGTGYLSVKMIHNLRHVAEEIYVMDYIGASTSIEHTPPILLDSRKSARNFRHLCVEVTDINGDPITFTNLYLNLYVETLNWQ